MRLEPESDNTMECVGLKASAGIQSKMSGRVTILIGSNSARDVTCKMSLTFFFRSEVILIYDILT